MLHAYVVTKTTHTHTYRERETLQLWPFFPFRFGCFFPVLNNDGFPGEHIGKTIETKKIYIYLWKMLWPEPGLKTVKVKWMNKHSHMAHTKPPKWRLNGLYSHTDAFINVPTSNIAIRLRVYSLLLPFTVRWVGDVLSPHTIFISHCCASRFFIICITIKCVIGGEHEHTTSSGSHTHALDCYYFYNYISGFSFFFFGKAYKCVFNCFYRYPLQFPSLPHHLQCTFGNGNANDWIEYKISRAV